MSQSPLEVPFTSLSNDTRSKGPTRVGWLRWLLVASLVGLILALGLYGGEFYALDVQARVDHPQFRNLSPAGPLGQSYGMVGTGLILTNLLYLLRRRFARMHLGSMRTWLDLHVFTGLFGSTLVVFHSAFQLRSEIARLTAVSLGVVVVSGLVGRYFYAISPRRDPARMREALARVDAYWPGLSQHLRQLQTHFAPPTSLARPNLLSALATIPTWLGEARMRRRALRKAGRDAIATAQLPRAQARALGQLVDAVADHSVAEVKATAGEHLLRTWRALHRMMAVLMIVSVTVHIAVAVYFGFGWSMAG